jgi:hypothetical protein
VATAVDIRFASRYHHSGTSRRMDAIRTGMMMTTKAKRELGVRAFASG